MMCDISRVNLVVRHYFAIYHSNIMKGTCSLGRSLFFMLRFDTKYMMVKLNYSWEMFCDPIYNLYLCTE